MRYSGFVIDSDVAPRRGQRAPRPSKGDRRERALLEAAGRMLESGRFSTASIADLADEAEISRASFYFYFASKQALLATLVDEAVSDFNARIVEVLESDDSSAPAAAVRATVDAAAELWWNHRAILLASVELGTTIPDVYERAMANFAIVRAPTVELLQRHGQVPEAGNRDDATALVMILMLMTERNFFDLLRGSPTLADMHALTERLAMVWLRAFGLEP
jgi:TetR/AcrR family transcriptional regulator, ethionamide resistance regulator